MYTTGWMLDEQTSLNAYGVFLYQLIYFLSLNCFFSLKLHQTNLDLESISCWFNINGLTVILWLDTEDEQSHL